MIEHDPSGSMIARVFFTANPSVYTPIHESIRKLEMAVESADSQKAVGAGCRTLDSRRVPDDTDRNRSYAATSRDAPGYTITAYHGLRQGGAEGLNNRELFARFE